MTVETLRDSFAGRRVFVTGHTGFKGAWLVALLHRLGADVVGYALLPETTPALYTLLRGDELCECVIADLRDGERLARELTHARPDYVLHLGAQSLVRRSYREPTDTFASNVAGTVNLLEAVRRYAQPCAVVCVTTDKVYAERDLRGYAYGEGDPLGGHDPYSSSKACCELVADCYRKSFAPLAALATARAGNVIGGGDWCEDRLVPDVARALAAGQSVRVRNPDSVRPWQHVLEPLVGYLLLAAKLAGPDGRRFARAYNFGPGADDALRVEDVVKASLKAWGEGSYHVDRDPGAPHEAGFLQIDATRARRDLGWQPQFDGAAAIRETMSWYRRATREDARALTFEQIDHYLEAAP